MKQNKLYILFLGVFISMWLSSCDLDTKPSTKVDEDSVMQDARHFEKIITGSMVNLMESFYSLANPGYGAFLRADDAMGSDAVLNRKYGFSSHYSFTAIYGKGGTNTFSWNLTYQIINNMNIILRDIDNAQGDEELKDRIKAQALAMRGFMYLHLASHYSFAINHDAKAVSVPIYTEKEEAYAPLAASSVAEVYAQVLSDIDTALDLLPENYARAEKWQIDRSVILGIAARASLYAREWEKAATYSDELLRNHSTSYLMNEKEYASGFNDLDNGEWIWGHAQRIDQDNASYQFHFLDTTSPDSYYYSFNVDPYFRDLFDEGDYRKAMIYWAPDPGKNPAEEEFVWMRYAKFKFKKDQIADVVLMRNSEIYLINAEAKAHLGEGDATHKLNALKTARGAQLVQLSGDELLEEIYLERRKELFGEGFSLVDLIRLQKSVQRKEYPQSEKVEYTFQDETGASFTKLFTPQGHRILNFPDKSEFTANSKYYLYRIPDTEVRSNKLLYSKYPPLDIF